MFSVLFTPSFIQFAEYVTCLSSRKTTRPEERVQHQYPTEWSNYQFDYRNQVCQRQTDDIQWRAVCQNVQRAAGFKINPL